MISEHSGLSLNTKLAVPCEQILERDHVRQHRWDSDQRQLLQPHRDASFEAGREHQCGQFDGELIGGLYTFGPCGSDSRFTTCTSRRRKFTEIVQLVTQQYGVEDVLCPGEDPASDVRFRRVMFWYVLCL